jgi:hypothetical protein
MTTCIELYVPQCVEVVYRLNLSSGMLNLAALHFSEMLLLFYKTAQDMTFQKTGLHMEPFFFIILYFWILR